MRPFFVRDWIDLTECEIGSNHLLGIGNELEEEEDILLSAKLSLDLRECGEIHLIGRKLDELFPVSVARLLLVVLDLCLILLSVKQLL